MASKFNISIKYMGLFFALLFSQMSSADWGAWSTVSAYPGLEVRAQFFPKWIGSAPYWKIELRNNSSSEIYIEFEITDVDKTLTSAADLTNGMLLQPGQSQRSGDEYNLKAEENGAILVWLGNFKISGILQDPVGAFSNKLFGDGTEVSESDPSSGGSSGGTGSTPIPPPEPDPCLLGTPTFPQRDYAIELSTATAPQSLIGTFTATDPNGCSINYSLASTYDASSFNINQNGELFLAQAYAQDPATHPGYDLTVIANNGYWSGFLYIHVDFVGSPSINFEPNQTFFIKNSDATGQTVGQVTSSYYQGDVSTVQYSISSGNNNNIFSISNSGTISIANSSPLSSITSQTTYNLLIQGTDGVTTGTGIVSIVVSVNDAPVIAYASFTIPQITNDPVVGRVNAHDPDVGPNNLSYSIIEGNDLGYFKINQNGTILVINSDGIRDSNNYFYGLTVSVSDGFQSASNLAAITITPNTPPVLDTTPMEGELKTSYVGILKATDFDRNRLSYSILSGNGNGVFEIRNNGLYRVGELAQEIYQLEVQVSDGLNTNSGVIPITFSNRPYFEKNQYYYPLLPNNVRFNTTIGTVTAKDVENDPLTFSMGTLNGFVQVESDTGRLYFIAAMENYDWDADSYSLKSQGIPLNNIQVSDGLFTNSTSAKIAFMFPFTNFSQNIPLSYASPDAYETYLWNEEMCSPLLLTITANKDWVNFDENFRFEMVSSASNLTIPSLNDSYEYRSTGLYLKGDLLNTDETLSFIIKVTDLAGNEFEGTLTTSYLLSRLNVPEDYFDYKSCKAGYKIRSTYQHSVDQLFRSFTVGPKEIHLVEFTVEETGTLNLYSTGNLDLQASLRDESMNEIIFDDDSGLDSNFDMTINNIAPGNYRLKVVSLNNDITQNVNIFTDFTANQDPVTPSPSPSNDSPSEPASDSGGGSISKVFLLFLLLLSLYKVYSLKRKLVSIT